MTFLELSSEEQVADTVKDNYINSESSYDSENYTASYDVAVDNLINPFSTGEGAIHESGYYIGKTPRSEEVEISESSMNIQTVYPIYKVNSIRYVSYDNTNPIDIDFTTYLYESSLYNVLESSNITEGKAIALKYTQGQKNITGLQYKVSKNTYIDAFNTISIRHVITAAARVTLTSEQLLNAKFIVEYVPYLNARIKYYKTNAPKLNIDTSMFQNQSANVVDARALGRKMVANIGRTGKFRL